jgi:WD40 repeat protein
MHSTGDLLVTGSSDGTVKVWGARPDFTLIANYDLVVTAAPLSGKVSVSSVCLLHDTLRSLIVVGTKASDIMLITRRSGHVTRVVTGHAGQEAWGLSPHPTQPDVFLSAADDRTLRLWSVSRKKQTAAVTLVRHESRPRCLPRCTRGGEAMCAVVRRR